MKQNKLKTITFGILALFAFAPLAQAQVSSGLAITGDVQVAPVKAGVYSVTVKTDDERDDSDDERSDDEKMEDGTRGEKLEVKEVSESSEREEEKERTSTTSFRDDDDDQAFMHINLRMEEKDLLSTENDDAESTTTVSASTSLRVMIRDVEDVHSEADLKSFVRTKAKEDKSIKQVQVVDGAVNVVYDEPAELFGFINTTVATHVTVDAKGGVQVTYPWYHIFMKKHAARESIQSNIARALAAERKFTKEGMASTTASASTTQATIALGLGIPNIFEIIANSLKGARVTGEASMQ